MKNRYSLHVVALGAVLMASVSIANAQEPGHEQQQGNHGQQGQQQGGQQGHPGGGQGNAQGNQQGGHPGNQGGQQMNQGGARAMNQGGGQQGGGSYHFRADDRNNLRGHYQSNLRQWQGNRNRPHFNAGDRLPLTYRIQPVPSSYYRGFPPPPPGYQFGYYGGYVVAYNPITRLVADVIDLVQ